MKKNRFGKLGIGLSLFVFFTVAALSLSGCVGGMHSKDKEEEKQVLGFVDGYNPMIEEIQNTLIKAGFDPGPVDGKMTWQTREAIKDFQKANGLKKTGYVNTETRVKLDTFKLETEAAQMPQPGIFPEGMLPVVEQLTPEMIKERLKSEEWIRKVQQALFDAGFDAGPVDGKMGSKTKTAVMEFQKSKNLTADGVIGKKTWDELAVYFRNEQTGAGLQQTAGTIAHGIQSVAAQAGEIISSDVIRDRLQQMEWIKKIQEALNNSGFDAGPVDGKMGNRTRNAVIEFQKSKGLKPDGVIGPKTWEELSKAFPQENAVSMDSQATDQSATDESAAQMPDQTLGY